MKRVLLVILSALLLMSSNLMSAKGLNDKPLYRTSGYKGSVALTDQLVFVGLDTSHGYMFNSHHYLGGGAGFFVMPFDEAPTFGRIFADYKAYFLKKNSTPIASVKAGWCFAARDLPGNTFRSAFEMSPCVGWNWSFNEKIGLDLSLGASLFVWNDGFSTLSDWMPKISIGIEF